MLIELATDAMETRPFVPSKLTFIFLKAMIKFNVAIQLLSRITTSSWRTLPALRGRDQTRCGQMRHRHKGYFRWRIGPRRLLCGRGSQGVWHPDQLLRDLPHPGVIGTAVRRVRNGAVRKAILHSKSWERGVRFSIFKVDSTSTTERRLKRRSQVPYYAVLFI